MPGNRHEFWLKFILIKQITNKNAILLQTMVFISSGTYTVFSLSYYFGTVPSFLRLTLLSLHDDGKEGMTLY